MSYRVELTRRAARDIDGILHWMNMSRRPRLVRKTSGRPSPKKAMVNVVFARKTPPCVMPRYPQPTNVMSIEPNELLALPAHEKLRLVELLWDNLGESTESIPLPDWVGSEASRRRDEMRDDPACGLEHTGVWKRIDQRNGRLAI